MEDLLPLGIIKLDNIHFCAKFSLIKIHVPSRENTPRCTVHCLTMYAYVFLIEYYKYVDDKERFKLSPPDQTNIYVLLLILYMYTGLIYICSWGNYWVICKICSRHHVAEILLKLNTNQSINQNRNESVLVIKSIILT